MVSNSLESSSWSVFFTVRLKVIFRFRLQHQRRRVAIRAKPAIEPIILPAIVPGGVVDFDAVDADADADDDAEAEVEVVGFVDRLDVAFTLTLVLKLELGVAWTRFRVIVVAGAEMVKVVAEIDMGRNPKATEETCELSEVEETSAELGRRLLWIWGVERVDWVICGACGSSLQNSPSYRNCDRRSA